MVEYAPQDVNRVMEYKVAPGEGAANLPLS